VQREEYVYLVPFVEDEHTVLLKAIIPSREATKQYLGRPYQTLISSLLHKYASARLRGV